MFTSAVLIGMGALDNEELFVVEGLENWRSTRDKPEEREKCGKTAKTPVTAATTSTAVSRVPFSVAQLECPLSPAITESGALPLSQPSLHGHRDERTVDELRQQGHRPPCQMCCNCGTFAVFCTLTPSICR